MNLPCDVCPCLDIDVCRGTESPEPCEHLELREFIAIASPNELRLLRSKRIRKVKR